MKIVFLIVSGLILWTTSPEAQAPSAPQNLPLYNLLTIQEVNDRQLTYGTYHVTGYVVKKYKCPSCPVGSLCKPCMPDHIVISDENKTMDNDSLSYKDLIAFVDETHGFVLGGRYRFLIHILDLKTSQQPVNDIKLIYFEAIQEEKTQKVPALSGN